MKLVPDVPPLAGDELSSDTNTLVNKKIMNLAELLKDSAYKLTPEEAVRQLYVMVLKDDLGYLAREGALT